MTVAPAETGLVAVSSAMKAVLQLVDRLADTRSPVLLQGESGTGKDLVARLLHERGARRAGPFVKVLCPAIPDDLLESELFGHEKGAFTDAHAVKVGRIEKAAGGTLFFDQVEELPLALQAKLLRVIEERQFERVGGTRTLSVDVRFVSASGVDLRQAVAAGRFREDLYHRLGVVPVSLPPLRERREDIAPLAEAFLAEERARGATRARHFSPEAMDALRGYGWPGNARDLRSAVGRAALGAVGDVIEAASLPREITDDPQTLWEGRERPPSLQEVELAYIRHVLSREGGNQTRAAAVLGISRKALWEKRRRHRLP